MNVKHGNKRRTLSSGHKFVLLLLGIVFLVANMSLPVAAIDDGAEQLQAGLSKSVMMTEVYENLKLGQLHRTSELAFITPLKPTVYLTFDDGPSDLTPQILDILQEEDVPATFFVLGQSAERYADVVQRIVQDGHALGNHTYDHKYASLYNQFSDFFSQVARTDNILYELTGSNTPLFRAPGGTYQNFDAFYFYYMEQAGYLVYDWDVDSGDAKRRGVPASEIIANVKQSPLKHELNVLLHDSAGHAETVKALPDIIQYYKDEGYTFAVLDRHVQPKTFTLTNSKWKRKVSLQSHIEHMQAVQQFGNERLERRPPSPSSGEARPVHDKQPADSGKLTDERELVLSYGGNRQVLGEEEYKIIDGHFHVPLDRLVEGLGGRITFFDHRAGVEAVWNGVLLSYVPREHKQMVHRADRQSFMVAGAQMEVQEGRLFVPLRETIERTGGFIPSYHLSEEKQEVHIRAGMGSGYVASTYSTYAFSSK